MKRIGIIDIGSNSVRLVLVDIGNNNSFRIFNEFKETVRLGEGVDETLLLQQEKIDLAIDTLKMFKNMCDSTFTNEIIPVATAAVRKAKNRDEFVNRAKDKLGLDIRVLSGEEEAYFAYWGVINSIDVEDGLIMDIGGGSTELILVKNRKLIESISLSFGSIDLSQKFNLTNTIKDKNIIDLETFLYDTFSKIEWLKDAKGIPLIGVGGTIRNMSKIIRRNDNYPLNITHNFRANGSDINNIYEMVREKKLSQRKKIKGLSKDRADIFVGATGAVASLIDYCNIDKVIVSGGGIREGIIYNYIHNDKNPVKDVLDFSINNIINKYYLNPIHSNQIYKLTKSLCNQILDFDSNEYNVDKIIKASSMLHDSGIHIRFYNHHMHSFYIILNSGINGLTHKEILMSAFVAASHRDKKLKVSWTKYKPILNVKDMDIVNKIGVLLRLAEGLDACLNRAVENVECFISENEVKIKPISHRNTNIEKKHAGYSASSFKKYFNKKLKII